MDTILKAVVYGIDAGLTDEQILDAVKAVGALRRRLGGGAKSESDDLAYIRRIRRVRERRTI